MQRSGCWKYLESKSLSFTVRFWTSSPSLPAHLTLLTSILSFLKWEKFQHFISYKMQKATCLKLALAWNAGSL